MRRSINNESISPENLPDLVHSLLEKYQHIVGRHVEKNISIQDMINKICGYYEYIIGCMPGNVYWFNDKGIGIGCNKNVLDLFGFHSIEQFKGLSFEDMGRIGKWTDSATQSFKNDTMNVFKTGEPKLGVEEPPLIYPDGRTIYFLTSRVPVFDYQGRVIAVVGISTDITERKIAEESLKQSKKEAEEANKIKSDFIENMQHDLRTPAHGVCSALGALVKVEKDIEKKIHLSCIYKSAKQLFNLCVEVTDFDKMENNEREIASKKFDLSKLIKDVIYLNKTAAVKKGLNLDFVVNDAIPKIIRGDNYRLKRILINLIGNSIKFTKQGSVILKISLLKTVDKKISLEFEIKDTGIGIPQDKKNFIYEKFSRGTPSNRGIYRGIGLGLRLVKRFVEDLSGDVEVQSSPEFGTTFYISLPFEIPLNDVIHEDEELIENIGFEDDDDDELKIEEKTYYPEVDKKNLESTDRLITLLIEDDALARMIAKNILEDLGCSVTTAVSVETAKDALRAKKYDVIVSDIGLPDGTGFDIARYIKGDIKDINHKTPIFALTAHSGKNKVEEAEKSGFLALLTKPLSPKKFNVLLDTHVRKLSQDLLPISDGHYTNEDQIIDWNYPVKWGIPEEEIDGLMEILYNGLIDDLELMKEARKKSDLKELRELLHKLKGCFCYVGVLGLQKATSELHDAIRESGSLDDTKNFFDSFYLEADKVLREYERIKK